MGIFFIVLITEYVQKLLNIAVGLHSHSEEKSKLNHCKNYFKLLSSLKSVKN